MENATDIDAQLPKRLRAARESRELSLQKLSDEVRKAGANLSKHAIAQIESGKRYVKFGEASKLAAVLDLDLGELEGTPDWSSRRSTLHSMIESGVDAVEAELVSLGRTRRKYAKFLQLTAGSTDDGTLEGSRLTEIVLQHFLFDLDDEDHPCAARYRAAVGTHSSYWVDDWDMRLHMLALATVDALDDPPWWLGDLLGLTRFRDALARVRHKLANSGVDSEALLEELSAKERKRIQAEINT